MTRSRRRWWCAVAVLGGSSRARVGGAGGGEAALDLASFQRVLRTGLDGELAKIADGRLAAPPASTREIHAKRASQSHVRGRTTAKGRPPSPDDAVVGPHYFTERVWNDLVVFAWKTSAALRRDAHRLAVTKDPTEACRGPFVVCARGRRDGVDGGSAFDDVLASFDAQRNDAVLLSASRDETCLVVTATASRAREVQDGPGLARGTLAVVPLVDVAKIRVGTIDEVSSRGWSVPPLRADVSPAGREPAKNETEALDRWERVIVVDLVPGVGGMKEEAELLEVVNDMMSDIQDMGEVGWLRSTDDAEEYLVEESLVGIPSLSDVFSLTSSLRSIEGNDRVAFWHNAFQNGMEAMHLCADMFSTLYVRPRSGYLGFDLVLNPVDGPPPTDEESSASNPACIASLIAGLSTYPYVLSVEARYPSYQGWRIAQQLDAA